MGRGQRCPYCGLQASETFLGLKNHIKTKHEGKKPLHRVYKLSNPKGLTAYLNFLVKELPDIVSHFHYTELRAVSQQQTIGWKRDDGRLIESVVHLTIDCHLHACTEERCALTRIDVNYANKWPGYTLSDCKKCKESQRKGRGEVWHLDQTTWDSWRPLRPSSSLAVSCITLELDPHSGWSSPGRYWQQPFEEWCRTCKDRRLDRAEYSSGYPAIFNYVMQWDICHCSFNCLWTL